MAERGRLGQTMSFSLKNTVSERLYEISTVSVSDGETALNWTGLRIVMHTICFGFYHMHDVSHHEQDAEVGKKLKHIYRTRYIWPPICKAFMPISSATVMACS